MKKAFVVAGGTGGHINAAIAIGNYLNSKEYEVQYYSGERPLDIRLFKNTNVKHLQSQALRYKNPFKILRSLFYNLKSFISVLRDTLKEKPEFMIGTGGYVCGAVLLVGFLLRVPIYILEQNSVMGLTNKILSKISNKIFYHFKNTKGVIEGEKSMLVGNPTREIRMDGRIQSSDTELNLLVFGGSLGALEVNQLMEKVFSKNDLDFKLKVVHQSGIGKKVNINSDDYKVVEYIDDMNKYYNWCDAMLCRAGASSISELRLVGKPTYLIPYKFATDDHQTTNAMAFKEESEFLVEIYDRALKESENVIKLNEFLKQAFANKGKLKAVSIVDPCELIYKEVSNVRN